MRKRLLTVITVSIMLLMCACGNQEVSNNEAVEESVTVEETETTESLAAATLQETEEKWARIPMVMVDGQMYYSTGKESTIEARCGMMDGEITSTVDANEVPTENNQSNFGAGYGYQFTSEDNIEIQMEDGKWYVYEKGSGEGKIRLGNSNKWYDKGYLSEETLKWLYWYNSLSEDEQLAINSVPKELMNAEEYTDIEIEEVPPFIRMENPSWEYYTVQNIQSGTKPFELKVIEETANEIIDTEEWFSEYDLRYGIVNPDEEFHCIAEWGSPIVTVYKGEQCVAELEFTEYMYSPDYVEKDKDFVEEEVHDAKIKDGVLYVSTFHYTYAASAPSNAYITAISLEDYSVLWKSQPLVCNSLNFEIVDDIIFCGYGFTAEDDYLYQLDRITGCVLEKYKLISKPDYIIYKDDKLYVRTYNTNYVLEVTE